MRILQINNFHYPKGGSDRYFLEITHLLREAGHEVRTFSTINPENVDENLLAIPAVKGVDTERVSGFSNILQFLFSPVARQGIYTAIKQFKPDLAHLHIYYGQLTASILRPLHEVGIPIVQTLHEYKLVCATHGLFANGQFCDACQGKNFWHAVLRKCNRGSFARSFISMTESYISDALGAVNSINHFIAVSAYQKDQLVRLGIPEKKITTLHHFTSTVAEHPPDQSGYYFLFVGRILEEKGIGILLDAYARLPKPAPNLKIVGTGNNLDYWKDYAAKLGLANYVEWLGFKTGEALNQLYRGCIALINPSLLNETFGLTCLEAIAQGRPVIATHVGAFPEVITNNIDGLLVEPGSSHALQKAIEQLLKEPDQALSMGCRGLEKAKKQLSRANHYQKLLDIYNHIVTCV
ncbi:MAG: glycosyltransferase family 4 protein [Nitrosomonas sp.]|nr:glycosyltransferase family 4 protein [Nitrosomonas sp.]